jgi:hypothetical protein
LNYGRNRGIRFRREAKQARSFIKRTVKCARKQGLHIDPLPNMVPVTLPEPSTDKIWSTPLNPSACIVQFPSGSISDPVRIRGHIVLIDEPRGQLK